MAKQREQQQREQQQQIAPTPSPRTPHSMDELLPSVEEGKEVFYNEVYCSRVYDFFSLSLFSFSLRVSVFIHIKSNLERSRLVVVIYIEENLKLCYNRVMKKIKLKDLPSQFRKDHIGPIFCRLEELQLRVEWNF